MMYALCLHLHVLEEGGLLPSSFFHYKTHSILGTEITQSSGQRSLNPRDRNPSPVHLHLLQAPYINKFASCLSEKKKVMLSLHIGLFTTIHLG